MSLPDTAQISSRLLFKEHPLEGKTPGAGTRVHLLLIGFGALGQALAVQAAKIAHFPHGERLRLTVLAPDAERRKDKFVVGYPQFRKICEVSFAEFQPSARALQSGAFFKCAPDERLSAVVCLDDDETNLATAHALLNVRSKREVPNYVHLMRREGLRRFLETAQKESHDFDAERFHAFGSTENDRSRELSLLEQLDTLARIVHEDYRGQQLAAAGVKTGAAAEGETIRKNPSLAAWDDLKDSFKDACRAQADHIDVKLRAIGCEKVVIIGQERMDFQFTPQEIHMLGRVEHDRWCAERRLDGWTLGPRDNIRKTRPNLISWDELSEDEKQKDYAAVANIPKLVTALGFGIRRRK